MSTIMANKDEYALYIIISTADSRCISCTPTISATNFKLLSSITVIDRDGDSF